MRESNFDGAPLVNYLEELDSCHWEIVAARTLVAQSRSEARDVNAVENCALTG